MKFSIRDILWLTILVAVAVTWWLEHRASVGINERLQQQAQQLRCELFNERRERAKTNVAAVAQRVKVLTTKVQAAQLEAASAEHQRFALPPP